MLRIFALGLLVIIPAFTLPAFASEEEKTIHRNTTTDISVAEIEKEVPGSKAKDLDGSLQTKKPEKPADHDHYGKFLFLKVLSGGGSTR